MQEAPRTPDLGALNDYEYEADLNGDNALAYVVELAGEGRRILELGAGSGMQTRLLARDRRNRVVAVEINPASAQKLARIVDSVHILDLNEASWVERVAAEGPFDAIVAADVLEHLYDPWAAMARMKTLLAEDGEIVVSLPYIGNGAVLGLIYEDDFDYRDEGLLDKTHIRFFGLRNIVALHRNAGLAITDARFVLRPPETTEFHARWNSLPPKVRRARSVGPHGNIYQVVTKARLANEASAGFCLLEAARARCAPQAPAGLRYLRKLGARFGFG